MKTKYFNDAIIGNQGMLASFSKTGELLRLFYPNTDYRQFIDFLHIGVTVNDSNIIYLHQDVNNEYNQYYTKNTNILNTEIMNTYFKLHVLQTDFIPNKEDVLIKKYVFTNKNNIELKLNVLAYSQLLTDNNNQVSGYYKDNALIQYMHDYTVSIFSKNQVNAVQINNNEDNIETGIISGKDYIGMSPDSSIGYDLATLKPGESKTIEICICARENKDKQHLLEMEETVEMLKKLDTKKVLESTKKYWEKYVKEHTNLEIKDNTNYDKKLKHIYIRTILLFPLLTNAKTGGISAAVEVDEDRTKCGRYSYCWPRDGIFITHAMDLLKMEKETEKFYKTFCRNTQSKNGMWEQRFYTDGTLAPNWGYQVDETAAVVYGVYHHYLLKKEPKFLKDNLKMCEKAVHFLINYVEDLLSKTDKYRPSYDIWEENEGVHAYSLAAIFAAFDSMRKIYEAVKPEYEGNRLKLEQIRKQNEILRKKLVFIKDYIVKHFYKDQKKCFVRSKDDKLDISLLGLVTPFKLFTPKDKRILNTIERINLSLRTYRGGYMRYEGDNYIGGNPWVLANLWLANYYIDAGCWTKAKECFDYVVHTATGHGFLSEQINNETMKPAWVVGLGWSHAMFIIVLYKLMNK